MDITLYLILSHFLADYPLQPGKLVAFKKKSLFGIGLHSFVHVLSSVALLFPFAGLGRFWGAMAFLWVTHGMIDRGKVVFQKAFPRVNTLVPYTVDQLIHLGVNLALSAFVLGPLPVALPQPWLGLYQNRAVPAFLLALVLSTYFYDVSRWTYRNFIRPQPYVRDYKMMARNALLVGAAFGGWAAVR